MKNLGKVYTSVIIAMIFWSLSFIWYKDAYEHFGPMTTVFLRLFISGVILSIISFFWGKLKIKKEHFKLFVFAAFFEPFLYFMGESFGMQLVSSVTASVIIATIPIFTAVAASLFYQEKLSLINISGIVISFAGVIMVVFSRGVGLHASLSGFLLMFLAVLAAIGYAMALRKLIPFYSAITIITIQNLIGMILFAPLFFFFEWSHFMQNFSFIALIPVINLSVFASSVAFILFAYSVSVLGVSKANTFTNLIPVMTSIFAFFLLNEQFTLIKIAGILIVVLGLFMSQLNSSVYRNIYSIITLKALSRYFK